MAVYRRPTSAPTHYSPKAIGEGHRDDESRALFKQHVALYHDRVKVAEAQRLIWLLRQWDVVVLAKNFTDPADHLGLRAPLPACRTIGPGPADDVRQL